MVLDGVDTVLVDPASDASAVQLGIRKTLTELDPVVCLLQFVADVGVDRDQEEQTL